jgi:hypothetical protein
MMPSKLKGLLSHRAHSLGSRVKNRHVGDKPPFQNLSRGRIFQGQSVTDYTSIGKIL